MGRDMSTRKPPPIVWRTCKHCGKRYDGGNALAAFSHRNRDCLRTDARDNQHEC